MGSGKQSALNNAVDVQRHGFFNRRGDQYLQRSGLLKHQDAYRIAQRPLHRQSYLAQQLLFSRCTAHYNPFFSTHRLLLCV
jgi:hypothetical protein